jgi:hypothetical protein
MVFFAMDFDFGEFMHSDGIDMTVISALLSRNGVGGLFVAFGTSFSPEGFTDRTLMI